MNDPHSFAGQAQLGRNLRENLGTTTLGLIERERRYLRHLAIVPHSHCLRHPEGSFSPFKTRKKKQIEVVSSKHKVRSKALIVQHVEGQVLEA